MTPSPEIRHLASSLCRVMDLAPVFDTNGLAVDWDRWLDLALVQRVAPLLGSRMAKIPDLPDDVRQELTLAYMREARESLPRVMRWRQVRDLLRAAGAEAVALKGVALWTRFYREAAERPMTDVDLLMRDEAAMVRLRDMLLASGWVTGRGLGGHHHLPVLRDEHHVLAVELHRNLVTPPLPVGVIDALWASRTATGGDVPTFDPVGLLFHHAIHAVVDPVDSPVLRNLFETGVLAARLTDGERASFAAFVRTWHLEEPCARALKLANRLFGTPMWLDAPRVSSIEHWCMRRLEWGSEGGLLQGVERSVGRRHLEAVLAGWGARNPVVPLAAAVEVAARPLGERVRARAGRDLPLSRVPAVSMDVGDATIVHVLRTGEVHLLSGAAAAAWRAAEQGLRPDSDHPREAIEALTRAGLLWVVNASGYPEKIY